MTTQNEFDTMMSEYRARKGKRTLPSLGGAEGSGSDSPSVSRATSTRKNPFLAKPRAR